MTSDNEIDDVLSVLSFSYKLFVKKRVADVALSTINPVNETNLSIDEEMIDVTPLS